MNEGLDGILGRAYVSGKLSNTDAMGKHKKTEVYLVNCADQVGEICLVRFDGLKANTPVGYFISSEKQDFTALSQYLLVALWDDKMQKQGLGL